MSAQPQNSSWSPQPRQPRPVLRSTPQLFPADTPTSQCASGLQVGGDRWVGAGGWGQVGGRESGRESERGCDTSQLFL